MWWVNNIELPCTYAHKLLTTILSLTNYCQEVFRSRLKFPGWAMPTLIFSRVGACPPCSPRAGAHGCYTVQCARLARTEKTAVGSLLGSLALRNVRHHHRHNARATVTCVTYVSSYSSVASAVACMQSVALPLLLVTYPRSTCSVDGLKPRLHFMRVYSDFNVHTHFELFTNFTH